MRVRELLSAPPVTVAAAAGYDRAMELMDEHDIRHLPVMDGDELLGVLSDRDLLEATGWLHRRERELLDAPDGTVGDLARRPLVLLAPEDGVEDALRLFLEHRIGSLPVVRDGALVGIVTEIDVLRAYGDACRRGHVTPDRDPRVADHMTPVPHSVASGDSCEEAADAMRARGLRHLPVLEGERLVGIVSDRDVRRLRGQGSLELTPVREAMSPEPRTARPDERLSSAALVLADERIGALPVVEGGALVGMLELTDALVPCARALERLGEPGNGD